jgi:hypothetical protein
VKLGVTFEKEYRLMVFGCKRQEVTGGWIELYSEELGVTYYSPDIHRVIKWRMRWAENVACMEEKRKAYRVLMGKPEVRDCLEDMGINGRIILKWILKKIGWEGRD